MTKVPCPDCGKAKYDPDLYDRCYACSMQEQGKKLCPVCQEGYYDAETYDMCYNCWKEKSEEEGTAEPDEEYDPDVSTLFR